MMRASLKALMALTLIGMAAGCGGKSEAQTSSAADVETLLTELVIGEGDGRAEILSIDTRLTTNRNGHIACGIARVRGQVEPFMGITVGMFPHHEKAAAYIVRHEDRDGGGVVDRSQRNWDALNRQIILGACDEVRPPEGVVWATEPEPNPDRAKAARARALASTLADVVVPNAD